MLQTPALKVLVIDDDTSQRMLVKEYLEAAGFVVRQAEDGKRGLKLAATTKPDVILLDQMLPSLDGFAVCACLKESPNTADIPVIFITGSRESKVIERGLSVGAVDFVTKPVDWDFLADRVLNVVRRAEERKILEKERSEAETVIQGLLSNQTQNIRFDISTRDLASAAAGTEEPATSHLLVIEELEKKLLEVQQEAAARVSELEARLTAAESLAARKVSNAVEELENHVRSYRASADARIADAEARAKAAEQRTAEASNAADDSRSAKLIEERDGLFSKLSQTLSRVRLADAEIERLKSEKAEVESKLRNLAASSEARVLDFSRRASAAEAELQRLKSTTLQDLTAKMRAQAAASEAKLADAEMRAARAEKEALGAKRAGAATGLGFQQNKEAFDRALNGARNRNAALEARIAEQRSQFEKELQSIVANEVSAYKAKLADAEARLKEAQQNSSAEPPVSLIKSLEEANTKLSAAEEKIARTLAELAAVRSKAEQQSLEIGQQHRDEIQNLSLKCSELESRVSASESSRQFHVADAERRAGAAEAELAALRDKSGSLSEYANSSQSIHDADQGTSAAGADQGNLLKLLISERRTYQSQIEKLDAERRSAWQFSRALGTNFSTALGNIRDDLLQQFGGTAQERLSQGTSAVPALETIETRINSALDLCTLARLMLGELRLEEKPLALDELISDLVVRLKSSCAQYKVSVHYRGQPGIGIRGDEQHLRFAILSLLTNAIKFSPPGNAIHVAMHSELDDSISVIVADHGFGIPMTKLEKLQSTLMHPYQVLSSTGERSECGIAIATAIVNSHGGVMEIQSSAGQGTVVTIKFPPSRRLPGELSEFAGQALIAS